jgi:hypothetical protein
MDKVDVIKRALRYPIEPVLQLYMRWFGVSEDEAHEHELELKRCLVLFALNKERRYSLGDTPVSNLWRTFIIFTALYSDFCGAVAGTYLHYTPNEADTRSRTERVRSYEDLLRDYRSVFGKEPPAHLLPKGETNSQLPEHWDQRLASR